MYGFEDLWNQHVMPVFDARGKITLGDPAAREAAVIEEQRVMGKEVEIRGPVKVAQDTVILCESFYAAEEGAIYLDKAVEDFSIVAKSLRGYIHIEKPKPARGQDGAGGGPGSQGPNGLAGHAGKDGKSASVFHSAKKGKPGSPGTNGGKGGPGARGGHGEPGLDQGDVTVYVMGVEPNTSIAVSLPGGDAGNGGRGGPGGVGGTGGWGGNGGRGGRGNGVFHAGAKGGAGGQGGHGGDGGDGGRGGDGANGGNGGNLILKYTDISQLNKIIDVVLDCPGGRGGAKGTGGQAKNGGSGGKGGVGGKGGSGRKPGPNGADGLTGQPGRNGPDGEWGLNGQKGTDVLVPTKVKISEQGFIAAAFCAIDEDTAREKIMELNLPLE